MKVRIFLILVLISIFSFSQTHRFIYELKYKKDSSSEKFDKQNMVLDINGKVVQFYEYRAIRIDSINKNTNGFSNYTFPLAKLKRETSSFKNQNYYFLNDNYFVFTSNKKIDWKIQPETKTKENWKLQKALQISRAEIGRLGFRLI